MTIGESVTISFMHWLAWRRFCLAAGFAAMFLLWAGASSNVVSAATMASHRAFYDVRLGAVAQGGGIIGANGVMSMAFEKSCEGWVLRQQMSIIFKSSDGKLIFQESRYGGLESFDGKTYRFATLTKSDADKQEYKGSASLNGLGKAGAARYDGAAGQLRLPAGTVFPITHTAALIDMAKRGGRHVVVPLFDGTEGKGAEEVSAFIGLRKSGEKFKGGVSSPLLDRPGWPVRMAVFSGKLQSEPQYEMGFFQLDNGVSQNLTIEYNDFSLHFDLTRIEPVPAPAC
jgi:hypothetical protein